MEAEAEDLAGKGTEWDHRHDCYRRSDGWSSAHGRDRLHHLTGFLKTARH